ncbi:hypothetical protein G6F56_011397 [Rhizopus delemar]|nr:hypothetical protein G6F56_011397 [Rhizopus delemar]
MSNDEQTPTLQEHMALLQQQLQQQQQQQQSPAHQPQPMQDNDDSSPPAPHLYPPIAALDYRPPDAVPTAYGRMNESQRSHDASLKSIQYLLSAVFRPLDLLGHQLLNAQETNDIQHSLKTLHDARTLLLNASNSVNTYRNGIVVKAVNKSFKPDLSGDSRHTIPSDQFHSMIGQLNSTQKTIKEAQQGSRLFRRGPPSQYGGKTFNNNGSNNNNNNNNNFASTSSSNNNRFNQHRKSTHQSGSISNFSKDRNNNN